MSKYDVLLTVYKTKSISKTAELLAYTPSAVSQAIRSYEKSIGVRLFHKTKNGMEVYSYAERIMEAIDRINQEEKMIDDIAIRITNLEHGHIRIGSIQSISYHWLPQILSKLSSAYPELTYEVHIAGFKELKDMLDNFELDCIFTAEYAIPGYPFVSINRDELLLVTPRDHELANRLSVSISALRGYNFLLSSDGLSYETGELFKTHGIQLNSSFQLNEDFATLRMVEAGFGIAILPQLLLSQAPFDVCIRSFNEHYTRNLGVAYRPNDVLMPAVEKLIDFSREWAEENNMK